VDNLETGRAKPCSQIRPKPRDAAGGDTSDHVVPAQSPPWGGFLSFLRAHGIVLSWTEHADPPQLVVHRSARPSREVRPESEQPLLQQFLSLVAAYRDSTRH
jgi:hypothetical protein